MSSFNIDTPTVSLLIITLPFKNTLDYREEESDKTQQRAIRRWRDNLHNDKLVADIAQATRYAVIGVLNS